MSTPKTAGNIKKRGHQHHPRNEGSRRRIALNTSSSDINLSEYSKNNVVTKQIRENITKETTVINKCAFSQNPSSKECNARTTIKLPIKCDNEVIDLTNCDEEISGSIENQETLET